MNDEASKFVNMDRCWTWNQCWFFTVYSFDNTNIVNECDKMQSLDVRSSCIDSNTINEIMQVIYQCDVYMYVCKCWNVNNVAYKY